MEKVKMETVKTYILSEKDNFQKVLRIVKPSENCHLIDIRLKVKINDEFCFSKCGVCLNLCEYEKICGFLEGKGKPNFGDENRSISIEDTNYSFIKKITLSKLKNMVKTISAIQLTDQEMYKIIKYHDEITKIVME